MEIIQILLKGFTFNIRYAIHDSGWIEWYLLRNSDKCITDLELKKTEEYLRIHHTSYIQYQIQEYEFYKAYAEHESFCMQMQIATA